MPDDAIGWLYSFAVSLFAIGGCIGGLLGAEWAECFGRYDVNII
jgi:hypothetical protein